MDEIAIWSTALSDQQIIDLYKRGASRHQFQVRSCDDDACSGESFVGPNGTGTDFYDETDTNTTGLPSFSLTNVSDNRYFQYQVCMEQDNSSFNASDPYNPFLKSVTIGPTHYNAGDPTIVGNTAQAYSTVSGFAQTLGGGNAGTVKYQISNDNGSSWYYWNGAAWAAASGYAQTNTAADINSNIGSFAPDSNKNFKFKAFLHSANGTQAVELSNVQLTYASGSPPTLTSIVITDSGGYTNSATPAITITSSGSPTDMAFSCNGGSNWSDWIVYASPTTAFNITSGATGCSATNELKTITANLKNASGESSTAQDTTTYDSVAPTVGLDDNHADLIVRDAGTVVITATFNENMAATPAISIDVSTGSDVDISAAAQRHADMPVDGWRPRHLLDAKRPGRCGSLRCGFLVDADIRAGGQLQRDVHGDG